MSSSDDNDTPGWSRALNFEFTVDTTTPLNLWGETIAATWTANTVPSWGLSHTATVSHNSWLLTLDNTRISSHSNVVFLECLDGTYIRINNDHLLNDMDMFILSSITRASRSSKKVKKIIDTLFIYK